MKGSDIHEGSSVMIMTGKLQSFYGHVISIKHYQSKKDKALVETLDEENKKTWRWYNIENLIKD